MSESETFDINDKDGAIPFPHMKIVVPFYSREIRNIDGKSRRVSVYRKAFVSFEPTELGDEIEISGSIKPPVEDEIRDFGPLKVTKEEEEDPRSFIIRECLINFLISSGKRTVKSKGMEFKKLTNPEIVEISFMFANKLLYGEIYPVEYENIIRNIVVALKEE